MLLLTMLRLIADFVFYLWTEWNQLQLLFWVNIFLPLKRILNKFSRHKMRAAVPEHMVLFLPQEAQLDSRRGKMNFIKRFIGKWKPDRRDLICGIQLPSEIRFWTLYDPKGLVAT